ncbi:IclR family transcriptional regulator [Variovorax sp. dw_308]|uniref:IclR family transcriptional regulator n=1 Tax=Variovorax sp. dw_308 TaxID=2721546 RepID=UPI001C48218F|nr:IclR family transcriptional regulator [Variovorax sp. dw_308]
MFATSLANGLSIMKCFKVGEPALGNREFAERTGLSKATVSRLTYTLGELGFLKYDAEHRRYRLGSATLSAGYPLLANMTIRQLARPLMKALADQAHGSVSLGMRDRAAMVYVETCRGHESIAFRPDIGASLPLLDTAMGRAWLAGTDEDQRREVLRQIQADDPTAWKTHGRAVQDSLRRFADAGACFSKGDWQQDIHAVAVPMRLEVDSETLVFTCGVPAVLSGRRMLEDEVAPALQRLVREVESAWLAHHEIAGL